MRSLKGSHEEDVLGLVVLDEEHEGAVAVESNRQVVSTTRSGLEHEDGRRYCSSLCALFVHLHEGLVYDLVDGDVSQRSKTCQVHFPAVKDIPDPQVLKSLLEKSFASLWWVEYLGIRSLSIAGAEHLLLRHHMKNDKTD